MLRCVGGVAVLETYSSFAHMVQAVKATLPPYARAMDVKGEGSYWKPLSRALEAPWVQLHLNDRHFLIIDFDGQGVDAWKELLLEPNFISYNNVSGNHQAFFWLRDPVHCHLEAKDKKPYRYLSAIEAAIDEKYNGDDNFTRGLSKNPFSPFWDTDWRHDKKFTLNEIEIGLDLDRAKLPKKYRNKIVSKDTNGTKRNGTIFDTVRFRAYKEVKKYKEIDGITFEDWHRTILNWAKDLNSFDDKDSLSKSEVSCIAKSISRWVWYRYNYKKTKKRDRKTMSDSELKNRQKLAAEITNKARVAATEAKVKVAIKYLVENGKKPTKSAVAKIAKISREQVSKKYNHLFPTQ